MRKLIGMFVLAAAVIVFTAPAVYAACSASHKTAQQSSPAKSS